MIGNTEKRMYPDKSASLMATLTVFSHVTLTSAVPFGFLQALANYCMNPLV